LSQWHADLDQAELGRGAQLTVLSDHMVVRLITSDTLSIERPDGQRFSALILDRTAASISLVLEDGRQVSLRLWLDETLNPGPDPDAPFSRQKWVTN